ncbi:hypothetical protein CPB83DRAFT_618976 [Crepidotus variabilis]|uniref:Uncharacterized protein n=1 Tax=Crepidotus variabilis TaxID=179855 RepID=A0A9P6E7V9_9AGAR|nr:hypothetical protein CPB83DRAFT_618976 [Crepidotus variabilis]
MATDLASDPVSSLRAAALSTLKSKRRKPAIDRSVPISERPQPPKDVFQLDYGQEESSSDVPMADATTSTQAPSPVQPKQDDLEAPPGRDISLEEGEISDDEPVVTPLRSARKQPTPPRKVFSSPRPISPEPRVLAEARQLVRSSSTRSSSSPEAGPSRQSSNHVKTSSEHPTARIPTHSPQFVRPNVNLTQNEYDAVKDVVLDLLGWGVPPIHFVECGVSREALFYVFSELNLALPDGFDSSGLVPFTPEDYTKSKSQQPIIMPPPPIPEKEKRPILEILTPNSTSPLETPNTDISMTLVESPLTSLNDIERQRRLELRARKAAQATRKLQYSTSTESGSGASSDSQAPPLIVSPDVDDFLSSLGPQLVMAPSSIEHFSTEAKECKTNDEPNSPQSNLPDYSPSSQEASLSVQEPPPASADSVVTFESTSMSVTSDSAILPESPAEFEPPLPHPVSAPIPSINYPTTRRGVKRAVATDFDFDQPAPRRNGSTPQPAKQAKTAFVSIGSRRCVIDLSDSEDDDESPPRYQPLPVVLDQQPWHKRDRRTKASTYPSPVSSKPMTPVGGAVSPSVLLQKELEIRRMRELIAQREEETRLKKLAAKSITSAISSAPVDEPMVVIAQPQPIRLKTEEPDIEMSSPTPIELTDDADAKRVRAEIIARRSSESASPPAEISEASLPITRSVTVSPISPSQDFTPGKYIQLMSYLFSVCLYANHTPTSSFLIGFLKLSFGITAIHSVSFMLTVVIDMLVAHLVIFIVFHPWVLRLFVTFHTRCIVGYLAAVFTGSHNLLSTPQLGCYVFRFSRFSRRGAKITSGKDLFLFVRPQARILPKVSSFFHIVISLCRHCT